MTSPGTLMDLSSYGTGPGLKVWSLVDEINSLSDDQANNLVDSTHRFLMSYGGWNNSLANFAIIATELVYNVAESLYFWKQNVRAFNSPFRQERIGSYQYTKMTGRDNPREGFSDLLMDHPFIQPLITYLRDRRQSYTRNTRVFQDVDYNAVTGIRDIVLKNYSNRVERAIKVLNIVSDTPQFNALVYGDPLLIW